MVNRAAMRLASLSDDTEDPAGGMLLRYQDGRPTGILLETAADLVYEELAEDQKDSDSSGRMRKAFQMAVKTCLENGITTFHDASTSFSTIDFFKNMVDEGELKIRLWVMINEDNQALKEKAADYKMIGYGDNHLTVRAIKRFIDGALGAHGAWFFEPYADMPQSNGLVLTPLEELQKTADLAIANGFQLCTHAIGDRGNKEILDIYEKTFDRNPGQDNLRWRVEHAQHLRKADVPRFAQLGVIPSMQTNHCTSDGPWVVKRLGEERAEEGAYVWQKLISAGALIANGTDAPVENIDPVANFYSAITRKMSNGKPFYPDQRLTWQQALESYTINGAYAGFEEDLKGSITAGKLADFTILSEDILSVPEERIPDAEVIYTIVGGKVLFSRKL
jgi:hypothetical protein